MEKKCSNCRIVKPISDYHIRNASPDGHDYYCKECRIILSRQRDLSRGLSDWVGPESELEQARNILLRLGYVLDDPKNPVHQQFDRWMKSRKN